MLMLQRKNPYKDLQPCYSISVTDLVRFQWKGVKKEVGYGYVPHLKVKRILIFVGKSDLYK